MNRKDLIDSSIVHLQAIVSIIDFDDRSQTTELLRQAALSKLTEVQKLIAGDDHETGQRRVATKKSDDTSDQSFSFVAPDTSEVEESAPKAEPKVKEAEPPKAEPEPAPAIIAQAKQAIEEATKVEAGSEGGNLWEELQESNRQAAPAPELEPVPEPAPKRRRKRRTKAEIEAEDVATIPVADEELRERLEAEAQVKAEAEAQARAKAELQTEPQAEPQTDTVSVNSDDADWIAMLEENKEPETTTEDGNEVIDVDAEQKEYADKLARANESSVKAADARDALRQKTTDQALQMLNQRLEDPEIAERFRNKGTDVKGSAGWEYRGSVQEDSGLSEEAEAVRDEIFVRPTLDTVSVSEIVIEGAKQPAFTPTVLYADKTGKVTDLAPRPVIGKKYTLTAPQGARIASLLAKRTPPRSKLMAKAEAMFLPLMAKFIIDPKDALWELYDPERYKYPESERDKDKKVIRVTSEAMRNKSYLENIANITDDFIRANDVTAIEVARSIPKQGNHPLYKRPYSFLSCLSGTEAGPYVAVLRSYTNYMADPLFLFDTQRITEARHIGIWMPTVTCEEHNFDLRATTLDDFKAECGGWPAPHKSSVLWRMYRDGTMEEFIQYCDPTGELLSMMMMVHVCERLYENMKVMIERSKLMRVPFI